MSPKKNALARPSLIAWIQMTPGIFSLLGGGKYLSGTILGLLWTLFTGTLPLLHFLNQSVCCVFLSLSILPPVHWDCVLGLGVLRGSAEQTIYL